MTRDDIAAVLGYLSAAYRTELTAGNVTVWAEHLAPVIADDALRAAGRLIRTSEFFPSIAAFLEACSVERNRRAEVFTGHRALEPVAVPRDETAAGYRRLAAEASRSAAEARAQRNQGARHG